MRARRALTGAVMVLPLVIAAPPPASAQAPLAAWTEVQPDTPIAGSPFRLLIHIQAAPQTEIRVLAAEWPPGIRHINGPTLEGAGASGETSLSYTLEARRTGDYALAGFLIRIDSEALFTRPTPVRVVAGSARRSKPTAAWIVAGGTALVGQTVPLELVVLQRETLRLPRAVEAQPPRNAWFERSTVKATMELPGADGPIYQMPVARYLLTPTQQGPLTVPSARVVLDGGNDGPATLFSPAVTLRVNSPPAELGDRGAIGRFAYTVAVPEQHASGSPLTIATRISGSGSLKFVSPPPASLGGLPPTTVGRVDDVGTGPDGYYGTVSFTYHFPDVTSGRYRLVVGDLPTFDPHAQAVRVLRGVTRDLVVSGPAAAADPPAVDRQPLAGDNVAQACRSRPTRPRSYLLLLPPPLLLLGWLAFRRGSAAAQVSGTVVGPGGGVGPTSGAGSRAQRAVGSTSATATHTSATVRGNLRRAIPLAIVVGVLTSGAVVIALRPVPAEDHFAVVTLIEAGNLALARGQFASAGSAYGAAAARADCPILAWYNLALVAEANGNVSAAVAWLRAAARYNKLEQDVRPWLADIENKANLAGQHRVVPFIDPEVPFFGMIVGFALAVGALALLLRTSQVGPLIGLVLLVVASSALGVLAIASVGDSDRALVIADEATLKRVPLEAASDWVSLQPGTTLALRGSHGDYDLVRTARGLDAWVRKGSTIVVPRARPNGASYRSR